MKISSNIVATKTEIEHLGIDIEKLTDDLTLPNPEYANMRRFSKGRFYKKVDTYICYLKKEGDNFIIPRYYNGEPDLSGSDVITGRTLSSSFSGTLRDYQKSFIDENIDTINAHTGILIEAPCGHGKTFLGIWLSYLRGVQTMILVPTYYLAKQWKQRIEEFSDATSVILRSTASTVPTDCDFTIVVIDLFSCRVLPDELVKNVGHVILDEAHRVGAESYLPILDEIPAKFRTALTATFRRNDGVHKILKYHFGERIKMPNRFPRPSVYGVTTGVTVKAVCSKNKNYQKFIDFLEKEGFDYTETKSVLHFKPDSEIKILADKAVKEGSITKTAHREIMACLKRGVELSYSVVDSYLNEHSSRRKAAISLIQKCMDAGRTVLFLSKRKNTLRALHKYFAAYKPMLIISETSDRSKSEESYLQTSCPLIFGVNQLAKEGLDIDRLDTLIIHLPMADTEQAIGRISRLCKDKKDPIAFYLLDDFPIAYSVFTKARKSFQINAEYKGNINLRKIPRIL